MQSFPNGLYTTMICLARTDQSLSAPSLSAILEGTLEELGFIRTYNLGPEVYLCQVQDRGGLLVCPHPGQYFGDAVDEKTEGMLFTVGLEETLKNKTVALFREQFANVKVISLSAPL